MKTVTTRFSKTIWQMLTSWALELQLALLRWQHQHGSSNDSPHSVP